MTNSLIYDFETLCIDPSEAVAICLATLIFDQDRFTSNPYEYEELVDMCDFIKFDVQEQVEKYGLKISKNTLAWWSEQGEAANKWLKPNKIDVSIDKLYGFLEDIGAEKCELIYTRGNTFDPIVMKSLLDKCGKTDPTPWWGLRDVRSQFDGMSYGHNISNKFMPEGLESKFVAHDPRHDIAMDVMRFQTLAKVLA